MKNIVRHKLILAAIVAFAGTSFAAADGDFNVGTFQTAQEKGAVPPAADLSAKTVRQGMVKNRFFVQTAFIGKEQQSLDIIGVSQNGDRVLISRGEGRSSASQGRNRAFVDVLIRGMDRWRTVELAAPGLHEGGHGGVMVDALGLSHDGRYVIYHQRLAGQPLESGLIYAVDLNEGVAKTPIGKYPETDDAAKAAVESSSWFRAKFGQSTFKNEFGSGDKCPDEGSAVYAQFDYGFDHRHSLGVSLGQRGDETYFAFDDIVKSHLPEGVEKFHGWEDIYDYWSDVGGEIPGWSEGARWSGDCKTEFVPVGHATSFLGKGGGAVDKVILFEATLDQ